MAKTARRRIWKDGHVMLTNIDGHINVIQRNVSCHFIATEAQTLQRREQMFCCVTCSFPFTPCLMFLSHFVTMIETYFDHLSPLHDKLRQSKIF
jgi:hypothetical protein